MVIQIISRSIFELIRCRERQPEQNEPALGLNGRRAVLTSRPVSLPLRRIFEDRLDASPLTPQMIY